MTIYAGRFANRTAIVTGGASGLGLEAAKRITAEGGKVCLWDMNPESLAKAKAEIGAAHTVAVDVSDAAAVEAAAAEAKKVLGKIDILVNSAGITGGNATTWELSPAVWRHVIEVNLVGSYLTCRSVVPHMIKAGYGRIINIASIAGKEGNPNASHYSASKAGLIGLTKSLGKELAMTGVLVNAVTPAAAKTPMFDSMKPEQIAFMLSKIPMGRFLEVDEAASMIGWLASEDCAFSTGAVFDLSGGRASY